MGEKGIPLEIEATAPGSPPVADVYRWAQDQADHLRAGRLDLIDAANLADEIDDVGHSEYDKLESALTVLLQHILKWDHQPERRSRSWKLTIDEQRARTLKQLKRNPSLRASLQNIVSDAYESAKRRAYIETDLASETFPLTCPYNWLEMTERLFSHDTDRAQR